MAVLLPVKAVVVAADEFMRFSRMATIIPVMYKTKVRKILIKKDAAAYLKHQVLCRKYILQL